MDFVFTKASAIELGVTGLCFYTFPNFTLVIFGIICANGIFRNFSKKKTSKIEKQTMRAAIYHPNEKYEYQFKNIELPKFSPSQVFIKVEAASINPIDYKLSTPLIPFMRWFICHTIGRDFSGTVVDVGNKVQHFKIGDAVYGNAVGGSLQEYTVADQNQIGHKPSNISFVEAAGLGLAGLTSYQALNFWGDLNGKKVLIIGASGGCGSFGVEIARYFGSRVYGVCSTKNIEMVKNLGADVVVDYTNHDQMENIKRESFDLIYDTVTSLEDPNQEEIFRSCLKNDGKYVAINGRAVDFLGGFTKWERKDYHCHILKWNRDELEIMKKMVEENKLKPKISEIYSLEKQNVKFAFEKLRSRRTTGKICFEI